jgi:hypothetical protein
MTFPMLGLGLGRPKMPVTEYIGTYVGENVPEQRAWM